MGLSNLLFLAALSYFVYGLTRSEESGCSFIVLFSIKNASQKWNKAWWGWSGEMTVISPQLGVVSIYARHTATLPNKVMKLTPGTNWAASRGALFLWLDHFFLKRPPLVV